MASDPMERGLPSNPYAERMVLGSVLLGNTALGTEALMKLEPDDFVTSKHRELFGCFRQLQQKNIPIDHVVVYEWFAARGKTEDIGGLSGIIELEEGLPELFNIMSYVEILKRLSGLRHVIYLAKEATERAFLQEAPPAEIAGHFAKGLGRIANDNEENGPLSMMEFVDTYKGGVDALMTPHLVAPGIPTGFPRFDELTDGLHEDEIMVLGAYSSSGKSALSLQWARSMAENGYPVGVFSMEMSRRSLFYRLICDEAQVAFQRFRRGQYSDAEKLRLIEAGALIRELPIHVDERSGMTPADYELRLKLLIEKHGVQVSVIDFIQLMNSNNKRAGGAEKMNTICMDLQSAIKRTHVPSIVLSQLNREQVKAKRQPELYDLKESSSIEQMADIAAFIWRESVTNRDKSSLKDQAKLLIRKARNTERKEIGMRFTGWRMHFDELTEDEEDAQG